MNYILKNATIKLSPHVVSIVDEIGKEFRDKYSKFITITSGTRTPNDQALAMYNNFEKENGTGLQRQKYKNKGLFDEIAKVYEAERIKGRDRCIEEMTKVIEGQVKMGNYISMHLTQKAFDIRTQDLKMEEVDFLLTLIQKRAFLSYQDKSLSKQPHIHVQMKHF